MARWTASAKWAEGPALDGQRDMPLALRLSEGLGAAATDAKPCQDCGLDIGQLNLSQHAQPAYQPCRWHCDDALCIKGADLQEPDSCGYFET